MIFMNKIFIKSIAVLIICFYCFNCGGTKPKELAPDAATNQKSIKPVASSDNKLLPVESQKPSSSKSKGKPERNNSITSNNPTTDNSKFVGAAVPSEAANKVMNKGGSYSNYLRVKTIYELAMEANPPLFFPHDEFETADEYKKRVTDQVRLMKEVVKVTSQKMDIKNAQRIQVALDKELKSKSIIESIMAESSSPVEFTPTDIGRYNPEKETFPIILHDIQYQISVPREEARTFKANFRNVKIKGIKQLKPKYDVEITVSKAHIRSRPNGSIIGIASENTHFEHVQDEDEWYKINYKGQFGFTHINNADLKLVDLADEYEFHDMVAIHPTTGSMFAMISVDKLVKAPLNLASRKLYESGQPDGPDQ